MADEQPESKTGKSILAEQLVRLGLEIDYNEAQLKRDLDPVMASLVKKLEGVAKASKLEDGMFGKNFFEDKIKAITGFDMSLVTGIKNLIAYGQASKNLNVDNKEFYNSLNLMGKGLVKVADLWRKKSVAEKEASKQSRETQSELANLDEQVARMEGMDKANNGTNLLSAGLEALGPEAATAAKGVQGMTVATEEATVAVRVFASAATLGLAAVVAGVILVGKTIYQMIVQAVNARAEFKKFDQMFGGIGSEGIQRGIKQMRDLNRELWGLGYSTEKVGEVVFNATQQGLNFSRAIDTKLVGSILELSGATGVATSEIGNLYTELLKTTNIRIESIKEIGDTWVAFNRFAKNTTTLGAVAFSTFKEGIMSSANALGIAANKGEAFTNKMTKDLMALSSLATNLSASVSGLNDMFESAGSLISSPDSPFRTLLAISGGANINQMLTNQFDKTEAMLKGITYLQQLNKSFGQNIQVTAQVAAQQLGISKEMAIKMINMRKDAIDDMRKAQEEISGLQTNAVKDAFNKVNSDLSSQWNRLKTMFTTFFQNAFGGSQGMGRLVATLERVITRFRDALTDSNNPDGLVGKLTRFVDKVADWVGNKLTAIIEWLEKTIDMFLRPETNVIAKLLEYIVNALMLPMFLLGQMLGRGLKSVLPAWMTGGYQETSEDIVNELRNKARLSNPMTSQLNNPLTRQLSANQDRQNELSSQINAMDKYNPDTVTYGRDAEGNVGFMTIAQKQFAAEEEKRKLAEAALLIQKEISTDIKQVVTNTAIRGSQPQQNQQNKRAEQASPVGNTVASILRANSWGLSDGIIEAMK
jgi:hypothetical protein